MHQLIANTFFFQPINQLCENMGIHIVDDDDGFMGCRKMKTHPARIIYYVFICDFWVIIVQLYET